MADNWKKLGDVVANLTALHNAAERDERGYREELLRMTSDKSRQSQMLAKLNEDLDAMRSDVVALTNENTRLKQQLAEVRRTAQ